MTNWKSFLPDGKPDEDFVYRWSDPAAEAQIQQVEAELKVKLPAELREFLLFSNGVGNDAGDTMVMPTDELISWNQETWTNYADWEITDADRLLLFGNWLGNGDMYAYIIKPKPGETLHAIVLFDHETGRASPQAQNLVELFTQLRDGKL